MTELSREYGEGLYFLCVEENLAQQALEELTALKALFRENPDFCRLVSNHSLSKAERVSILDKARFSGNKDYFDKAFDNFEKTVDKYKDCLRAKKKIIPREKYRELVKKNRQRRGQAWLAAEKLKQQSSAAGEKDK